MESKVTLYDIKSMVYEKMDELFSKYIIEVENYLTKIKF